MNIIFYVEGGSAVGLGHLRRSETLALEFRARGHECAFIATSSEAGDWLRERQWSIYDFSEVDLASYDAMVLDSYIISPEVIRTYAAAIPFLIGFHDEGEPNADFSILVSSVFNESKYIGKTHLLAGPQYKMIHPDIKQAMPSPIKETIASVAVTCGGSSAMAAFADMIAQNLKSVFPPIAFQTVSGLPGDEAARIFAASDIAISGGGQTMFELLYLGVPSIVISLGENQDAQIAYALAQGIIKKAGDENDPDLLGKLAETIRTLYSREDRARVRDKSRKLIDGKAAERIAMAIETFHESL